MSNQKENLTTPQSSFYENKTQLEKLPEIKIEYFGRKLERPIKQNTRKRSRSKIPLALPKIHPTEKKSEYLNKLCFTINQNSSFRKNQVFRRRKEWTKPSNLFKIPPKPTASRRQHKIKPNNSKHKETDPSVGSKSFSHYEEEQGPNLKSKRTKLVPELASTKREYLKRVSSASLIELQRIVSKKFMNYQFQKNYKRNERLVQVEINKLFTKDTNNKNLEKQNKKILKNVKFDVIKFGEPKKSLIPTRIVAEQRKNPQHRTEPEQKSIFMEKKSSILNLDPYEGQRVCSNEPDDLKNERQIQARNLDNQSFSFDEKTKKLSKLQISQVLTNNFFPKKKAPTIPQPNHVAKNIENIKKFRKNEAPISPKKEGRKKLPTKLVVKKDRLESPVPISKVPENKNVFTYSVTQHDLSDTSNAGQVILFILSGFMKYVPKVLTNLLPGLMKEDDDPDMEETKSVSISIDYDEKIKKEEKKLEKQKRFRTNENYYPPWEAYKHIKPKRGKGKNVEILPGIPDKDFQPNYCQKGQLNALIKHLESSLSTVAPGKEKSKKKKLHKESMTEFYKRVEKMEEDLKQISVQVKPKVSASLQCCLEGTDDVSSIKKNWQLVYPKKRTGSPTLRIFRLLKAGFRIFNESSREKYGSKSTFIIKRNVSSIHNTSSFKPLLFNRRHFDTETESSFFSLANIFCLPEFCKIWKKTPKSSKEFDKNVIISFKSSLPKSSTSFMCPALSNKNLPFIIVGGSPENKSGSSKKGKGYSRVVPRRKKGKHCLAKRSSMGSSLPDICYQESISNSLEEHDLASELLSSETPGEYIPGSSKPRTDPMFGIAIPEEEQDKEPVPARPSKSTRPRTKSVFSKSHSPKSSRKEKGKRFLEKTDSGTTLSSDYEFKDDLVETKDFSCDVDFVEFHDESAMTNDNCISSICSFESAPPEKNEVTYKDIDDLITMLKKEFGEENQNLENSLRLKKSHLWVANSQLKVLTKIISNSICDRNCEVKELKDKPKPILTSEESQSSSCFSSGDDYPSTESSKRFLIPNICWENLERKKAGICLQKSQSENTSKITLPEDDFTEISKRIDEKILEILNEYNICPKKFASEVKLQHENSKSTYKEKLLSSHKRSASLQTTVKCYEIGTSGCSSNPTTSRSIGLQTSNDFSLSFKKTEAKVCLCGDTKESNTQNSYTQCVMRNYTVDKEASTWETAKSFKDNSTTSPSFIEIKEQPSLRDATCGSYRIPVETETGTSISSSFPENNENHLESFQKTIDTTDSLVSLFKMTITEADSEKILNEVDFSNCACPSDDSQEFYQERKRVESIPECSNLSLGKEKTPRLYPDDSFSPQYTSSPRKQKNRRHISNSCYEDTGSTIYKDLPEVQKIGFKSTNTTLSSDDSFLTQSFASQKNRNAGKTFVSRNDYVTICPEKDHSQFYQFVYNDYNDSFSRTNKSEQSLCSCRRKVWKDPRPRTWEVPPYAYNEVKEHSTYFRPRSTSTPEGSFDEGGPEITYITIIRRWLFSEAIPEFLTEEFVSGIIPDSSITHYTYILRGWLTVDIIRDMLVFIGNYIKKEYNAELNLRNCASILKNWFQFAGLKTLLSFIQNPNFQIPQSRDYQKFIFQWLESPGMKNILNIAIKSGCTSVHNTEVPPVQKSTYKPQKPCEPKLQTANCQSQNNNTYDSYNYRKYGNKSAPSANFNHRETFGNYYRKNGNKKR